MTGRIFITGDKHGTFSPFFGLAEKNELHETDVLLITGDAGYVWNQDYMLKVDTLQQLFPGTIAFIDGNHENHALLKSMAVEQWNGGRVHRAGRRVFHLMRGEVYSIYGNCIFCFGGARSVDDDRCKGGSSWWQEKGHSWWKEEEPSEEEIEYGNRQFMTHFHDIDYILTHETPLRAREFIKRSKEVEDDYSLPAMFDTWYERIEGAPRFKKWYFGHMHVDQMITPKLRAIHNNILPIGEEIRIPWS